MGSEDDVTRYSIRYGTTRIPMVEILDVRPGEFNMPHNIVKRRYGWSMHHAYRRGLAWVREHGDPR